MPGKLGFQVLARISLHEATPCNQAEYFAKMRELFQATGILLIQKSKNFHFLKNFLMVK